MESFYDAVEHRRSVRHFLPDPVPREVLDRCLDAALRSPSSSNLQPWEFVVVRSPEARKEADRVCLNQTCVRTAPLLIAIVAHGDTWRRNRDHIVKTFTERGTLRRSMALYYKRLIPVVYTNGPWNVLGFWKPLSGRFISLFRSMPNPMTREDIRVNVHKSTALAAQTLMLALRAEGYDSCPMEGFDPWRARRLLGLSPRAEVCMFLAVGKRSDKGVYWDRALVPREWTVREI
jgi:nitroreductase